MYILVYTRSFGKRALHLLFQERTNVSSEWRHKENLSSLKSDTSNIVTSPLKQCCAMCSEVQTTLVHYTKGLFSMLMFGYFELIIRILS